MTGGAQGVTWPRVAADAAADPEQRTAGRGGGQAAGLPGAVRPWAARVFFLAGIRKKIAASAGNRVGANS
jgi:hypothetical protein